MKRRWPLIFGIVLPVIWIAFIFNERAEDNKRIREKAAAQLAYNSAYEIYRNRMLVSIEKWALVACGFEAQRLRDVTKRGSGFDEKECVRQAVQYHGGSGYPSPIEFCSLVDEASQGLNLKMRFDSLFDDLPDKKNVRNSLVVFGADGITCNRLPLDSSFGEDRSNPFFMDMPASSYYAAPSIEKSISEYLPRALLPPISLAVILWAVSAIYSRIRRSNFKSLFLSSKSRRVFRFGVAALLIYEFWLGFWVIVSDDWYDSHVWPQDWLILAVAVPVGLMMSYLAYLWAVAQNIKEADKKPSELDHPIVTQRADQALAPETIMIEETQKVPDTSPPAPAISVTHTAYSPEKLSSNYLVRHWRGELSLGVAYWGGGILALIVQSALMAVMTQMEGNYSLRAVSFADMGVMLFSVLAWLWLVVGTWRSADRHVARGGASAWANVAKFMVVIGFITMVKALSVNILPQVKELALIASGNDPIGEIVVKVSANGRSVIVNGALREGSADEIQKILDAVPGATSLVLQSNGGRLLEAQQLARAIRDRNLDTYVENQCLSACTFVFLAGKDRAATPNARIGFHQPSFPGLDADAQRLMTQSMMDIYRTAGLPESFIQRIGKTPPEDMWYPTREELIASNVITSVP